MEKEITYKNIKPLQESFYGILDSVTSRKPSQEVADDVTELLNNLFKEYGLEDLQFRVKQDGNHMTLIWVRPIDQLAVRALLPDF